MLEGGDGWRKSRLVLKACPYPDGRRWQRRGPELREKPKGARSIREPQARGGPDG